MNFREMWLLKVLLLLGLFSTTVLSRGVDPTARKVRKRSLKDETDILRPLLRGEGEKQEVDEDGPTLFTIANTNTGSTWKSLPFREKFQWSNKEAPCRPFKLKVPDERPKHEEIELCIFRQQLDFSSELDKFVHPVDTNYDLFEQREMRVYGHVRGVEKSVVFGRMVDKMFYGEISFFDNEKKDWIVFEVEEIGLLTKLLRHDRKILQNILYVMNKGEKSSLTWNAVVTQGVSLLTFVTSENLEDAEPKSFLIFMTSHNSYISAGTAVIKVDEIGRLNIAAPEDSVTIDVDGSVILTTKSKVYKFRPNGQTIVTKGKEVQTLHEHEGAVAILAFNEDSAYDCVLPPPSFRRGRRGGFLCRICLLVDKSFEEFYETPKDDDSIVSALNNMIDKVSWMFRSVDWDKDDLPDNIGLEYDSQLRQWDPNVGEDLEGVTKDDLDVIFTMLSQMDFSECCLALAYTMRAFPEGIYAKSTLMSTQNLLPTGICAVRTQGISSNVILISANSKDGNYTNLSPDQLTYLTAHEVAKAFGAPLDATGKEVCDQFKDEQNVVRHYIMWPDVLRNLTEEEKTFSSCSISVVHDALMGCQTACFETNHHPFCGNGLVEEGEECDCGSAHNCSKQLCCYARSGKYPCRKTGVPCPSSALNHFLEKSLLLSVLVNLVLVTTKMMYL